MQLFVLLSISCHFRYMQAQSTLCCMSVKEREREITLNMSPLLLNVNKKNYVILNSSSLISSACTIYVYVNKM